MSDRQIGSSLPIPKSLELYSVAETAAILGVSRKSVSDWINRGALPAARLGPSQRLLRIRRTDLEDFIAQGEVQSPDKHDGAYPEGEES